MKRMGWNEAELMQTSAATVQLAILDAEAESEAARIKERWSNR